MGAGAGSVIMTREAAPMGCRRTMMSPLLRLGGALPPIKIASPSPFPPPRALPISPPPMIPTCPTLSKLNSPRPPRLPADPSPPRAPRPPPGPAPATSPAVVNLLLESEPFSNPLPLSKVPALGALVLLPRPRSWRRKSLGR